MAVWQSTGLQNRLSQVRVLHQVAALEKGYALEWKASGLTQRELAEKLGVITGTIGYYERGAGQPKTDNLFALCDILHIRPADLLRLSLIHI